MRNLPGTERRERFVKKNKTLPFSDKGPPDRQTKFRVLAKTAMGFRSRFLFLSKLSLSLSLSLSYSCFTERENKRDFLFVYLVFSIYDLCLYGKIERQKDRFQVEQIISLPTISTSSKKGWATAFFVPLLQTFTNIYKVSECDFPVITIFFLFSVLIFDFFFFLRN